MAGLRATPGVTAKALEFAILTGCRTAEVRGAHWDEIEGDVWVIPAKRMKAGKEHKVPLSDRALSILAELPRESGLVFPSVRGGKALGNHALLRVLDRFEREVAEMALAHTIPNAVERSYKRTTLFDRRRLMMQMWSDFCAGRDVDGEIVPIRRYEVSR
jgi:integrase